jgi:hypothetical protein
MHNLFSTIYLAVTGIFFVGSGLLAVARPEWFAARLDLSTLRTGGLNEVRAQYGGFFTVLGIACALAAAGRLEPQFMLGVLALTFGGIVGGRLLSLLLDRGVSGYGPMIRALLVLDTAGGALALYGLSLG